jgi:hypothetical protein
MASEEYLPIGCVSEGTLRTEDLIDAFDETLRGVDVSRADEIEREYGEGEDYRGDKYEWWLEALQDALEERCPAYTQFGALEGDGACFGVWIDWYALECDERDGTVRRVDAGDGFPALDGLPDGPQYVLSVTDHGNATLYAAAGTEWREVWSVV